MNYYGSYAAPYLSLGKCMGISQGIGGQAFVGYPPRRFCSVGATDYTLVEHKVNYDPMFDESIAVPASPGTKPASPPLLPPLNLPDVDAILEKLGLKERTPPHLRKPGMSTAAKVVLAVGIGAGAFLLIKAFRK